MEHNSKEDNKIYLCKFCLMDFDKPLYYQFLTLCPFCYMQIKNRDEEDGK